MQYETIILELMTRIKSLETDVSNMKSTIQRLESSIISTEESSAEIDAEIPVTPPLSPRNTTTYTKMTEQMMDTCYNYGKKAHQTPNANIADYADMAAAETGMNRNSAFMYIYAVASLLGGKVFKRAISTKAMRKYFSTIYSEFGKAGLEKAITATRAHIKYRDSYGIPSDSISALCDEFQRRI